jgi:hypothetical protein
MRMRGSSDVGGGLNVRHCHFKPEVGDEQTHPDSNGGTNGTDTEREEKRKERRNMSEPRGWEPCYTPLYSIPLGAGLELNQVPAKAKQQTIECATPNHNGTPHRPRVPLGRRITSTLDKSCFFSSPRSFVGYHECEA